MYEYYDVDNGGLNSITTDSPPGWTRTPYGEWVENNAATEQEASVTTPAARGLVNGSASDTLAQISREQWADYKSRYVPLENKLIDAYDNPQLKAARMADVTKSAEAASDNAVYTGIRGLARYGQNYGDQKGLIRDAGLSKVTNVIHAQNTNRDQMAERDKMLLTGGVTSRGI